MFEMWDKNIKEIREKINVEDKDGLIEGYLMSLDCQIILGSPQNKTNKGMSILPLSNWFGSHGQGD